MQWCRNIANGGFQNALSHIGNAQYSSIKVNGEYETKPVAPISGFYTGKQAMSNVFVIFVYYISILIGKILLF